MFGCNSCFQGIVLLLLLVPENLESLLLAPLLNGLDLEQSLSSLLSCLYRQHFLICLFIFLLGCMETTFLFPKSSKASRQKEVGNVYSDNGENRSIIPSSKSHNKITKTTKRSTSEETGPEDRSPQSELISMCSTSNKETFASTPSAKKESRANIDFSNRNWDILFQQIAQSLSYMSLASSGGNSSHLSPAQSISSM